MKVVIITVLTIAVAVLSWADGLDDTWEFRPQVFWYEDPPRARTMYYLPADITERMQYITHLVFMDEAFLTVTRVTEPVIQGCTRSREYGREGSMTG